MFVQQAAVGLRFHHQGSDVSSSDLDYNKMNDSEIERNQPLRPSLRPANEVVRLSLCDVTKAHSPRVAVNCGLTVLEI